MEKEERGGDEHGEESNKDSSPSSRETKFTKWLGKQKFMKPVFDSAQKKTTVKCKECSESYTIPGELTEERRNECSPAEWKTLLKAAGQASRGHKCKQDELSIEPYFILPKDFNLDKPISEWTETNMNAYLYYHPNNAPELYKMTIGKKEPNKNIKIDCTFRHPRSLILTKPLAIMACVFYEVPAYRIRRREIEEAEQAALALEWVRELLDEIIYTIETEQAHVQKPTSRLKVSGVGRSSVRTVSRDSKYIYESMMILFQRYPRMPITVTDDVFNNLLNATFYGKPSIIEMPTWRWRGDAFHSSMGCPARLLFKPNALHAWLFTAKCIGGEIRLLVDTQASDNVLNDPHGFTLRPLPLHFERYAQKGVICAVICRRGEDRTEVHDRNLALPFALVGDKEEGTSERYLDTTMADGSSRKPIL